MIIIMFRKEEVWQKEYSIQIEHNYLIDHVEWQQNIRQGCVIFAI